jgi:hypothetical protein
MPACRTPDLRAFTAIRSIGGGGSDSCAAPQRRGSSVHRRIRLLRLTDNRLVPSRLAKQSRRTLDDLPNVPAGAGESPLFGFVSLQRLPIGARLSLCEGSQPSRPHPASAFGCAPAVFGATPLRRRLTSFAPATVDRTRSCASGLFLGGVPLSVPYGLDLVDWPRASAEATDRPTTLMGLV